MTISAEMRQRLGWKPELPDQRDRAFDTSRALRRVRRHIPASVDWREDSLLPVLPVQANLGSCVPHGGTFAYHYQQRQQSLVDYDPSRLFVYYEGRKLEDSINYDSGLYIRDALKVLNKKGAPHEDLWPYDVNRFRQEPPAAAYDDGQRHQAIGYESVPVKSPEVKLAVAAKHLVIIGFTVYTSFFYIGSDGFVPEPDTSKERVEGGHCMDVVGYRRMRGPKDASHYDYAIMANWWDPTFGDNGFCYMKMRWLCDVRNADDFWIITEAEA